MRMGLKRLGPCIYSVCVSCAAQNRFNALGLIQMSKKEEEENEATTASLWTSFPACILTRWVNSETFVPLQIAVEKTPSVAAQLLIGSKKLVGSLRS